jgi:hypothetical protein
VLCQFFGRSRFVERFAIHWAFLDSLSILRFIEHFAICCTFRISSLVERFASWKRKVKRKGVTFVGEGCWSKRWGEKERER